MTRAQRRPSGWTRWVAVAAAVSLAACERPRTSDKGGQHAADAVQREDDSGARGQASVVTFARPHLFIGEFETPVAPAVTVGSVPSPRTIVSDRPEIVSVDEEGRLVAHAQGRAVVRSLTARSQLVVDVVVARALRVEPPSIRLMVNESARVRVLTETGKPLPDDAVRWWSSSLQAARVLEGVVRAGTTAGLATIEARFGELSARADVEVVGPPDVRFGVFPDRSRVRVGDTLSFEARSHEGPVDAEWSSGEQRVVKPLQGGVFWAAAAGNARVCARNGNRRVCTSVEVLP